MDGKMELPLIPEIKKEQVETYEDEMDDAAIDFPLFVSIKEEPDDTSCQTNPHYMDNNEIPVETVFIKTEGHQVELAMENCQCLTVKHKNFGRNHDYRNNIDFSVYEGKTLAKPCLLKPSESVFSCSACTLGFSSSYYLMRHEMYCRKLKLKLAMEGKSSESIAYVMPTTTTEEVEDIIKASFEDESEAQHGDASIKKVSDVQSYDCRKSFEELKSEREQIREIHVDSGGSASQSTDYNSVSYMEPIILRTVLTQQGKIAPGESPDLSEPDADEKPHSCDLCAAHFVSSHKLTKHRRLHSCKKPRVSDVCQASFGNNCKPVVHQRRHSGERPHVCHVCAVSFTTESELTTHSRTHTGDRLQVCSTSRASFVNKRHLMAHSQKYACEKTYFCDLCPASFFHSASLYGHKQQHAVRFPHVCVHCSSTFASKSRLTTHLRVHTGDRPYSCDVCCSTFTTKGNLNTHRQTHFATRGNLATHQQTYASGGLFICAQCQSSYLSSRGLTIHMRTHMLESLPQ